MPASEQDAETSTLQMIDLQRQRLENWKRIAMARASSPLIAALMADIDFGLLMEHAMMTPDQRARRLEGSIKLFEELQRAARETKIK